MGPQSAVGTGISGAESVSIVRVLCVLSAYLLSLLLLPSSPSLSSGSVPKVLCK